ncbi:MAG: hypothetical protein EAZ07_05565 [Cytophagales bacterium]|nr:MAG: hypothetical protein EAZ07_05565 [Cytophagales bacterium]
METFEDIRTIEKETLVDVKFTKEDVIQNDDVRKRLRSIYLTKAETLGNNFKGKVKLFFKLASNEICAVETTIWQANDEHVTLKGGITIPTKAVCAVEF